MDRHQGRIWYTSVYEEGMTIHCAFPKSSTDYSLQGPLPWRHGMQSNPILRSGLRSSVSGIITSISSEAMR